MKNILLSASIPRDPNECSENLINEAMIVSALRALCGFAIRANRRIIWSGQPSITPLVLEMLSKKGGDVNKHAMLYQTDYYARNHSDINSLLRSIRYIPKQQDERESLFEMRVHMVMSHEYEAGIFIGGAQDVKDEFELFSNCHPEAKVIALSSTGGAAKSLSHSMPVFHGKSSDINSFLQLYSETLIDDILKKTASIGLSEPRF